MGKSARDAETIAVLARQSQPPFQHIIDGQKNSASGGDTINARSPLDGSVLTKLAKATGEDAETGIAAAHCATTLKQSESVAG